MDFKEQEHEVIYSIYICSMRFKGWDLYIDRYIKLNRRTMQKVYNFDEFPMRYTLWFLFNKHFQSFVKNKKMALQIEFIKPENFLLYLVLKIRKRYK